MFAQASLFQTLTLQGLIAAMNIHLIWKTKDFSLTHISLFFKFQSKIQLQKKEETKM